MKRPTQSPPERVATSQAANDAPATSGDPTVLYRVDNGAGVVGAPHRGVRIVLLPNAAPANDETERALDAEAMLAVDPEFLARLDAQRDAWIESMEATIARDGEPTADAESVATAKEGHGNDGT